MLLSKPSRDFWHSACTFVSALELPATSVKHHLSAQVSRFCLLLSLLSILSAALGYAEHCLVRIHLDIWDAIVFLRKRGQRRFSRGRHLFSDDKNGHNTWELIWPAEANPPALKPWVVSVLDSLLNWLGWASASLGASARASSLDREGSEL